MTECLSTLTLYAVALRLRVDRAFASGLLRSITWNSSLPVNLGYLLDVILEFRFGIWTLSLVLEGLRCLDGHRLLLLALD